MLDTREAIQAIGDSLAAFMKSGPQSDAHQEEIKRRVAEAVRDISATVEQATATYKLAGEDFLEKVIQVRGMPTRQIIGGDGQSGLVSSSGSQITQNFDALLPNIKICLAECVATYRLQAGHYFDQQISEFNSRLEQFLEQVPRGGTKDKAAKSQITEIKKELRQLAKWEKLFSVYKANSLAAEIEYIFSLQGNPLAAIWHYSKLDEQGEYQKTYDHEACDGKVYAVRGNWAIEKGLMKAGAHGYINDSTRPAQEVGCMCRLQWVYNLRSLPSDMITAKGRSELERVTAIIASSPEPPAQKSSSAAVPENDRNRPKSWLGRLFGRD